MTTLSVVLHRPKQFEFDGWKALDRKTVQMWIPGNELNYWDLHAHMHHFFPEWAISSYDVVNANA